MRISARLLVPAIGLAALASVPSASAASCIGTAEEGALCVEPANAPGVSVQEGPGITRCVFVLIHPTCILVTVPTYTVTIERGPGEAVYCEGPCAGAVTGPVQTYVADVSRAAIEVVTEIEEQHDWCWTGGTSVPRVQGYVTCMIGG